MRQVASISDFHYSDCLKRYLQFTILYIRIHKTRFCTIKEIKKKEKTIIFFNLRKSSWTLTISTHREFNETIRKYRFLAQRQWAKSR